MLIQVETLAEEEVTEEINKRIKTGFYVSCPISFAQRYWKAAENHTGNSYWHLMSITLDFYENFGKKMDEIDEKLKLLTHLTNKVFELEKKINEKKSIKTNDGEMEVG